MSYFDSIYADTLLPPRAVSVYMYLKDRSNRAGSCWPGIKTIARDMNLSRSTVKRALADANEAPVLNGGVVVKHSPRYATDAVSAAAFQEICRRAQVPTQHYANRPDQAGGATLGNIANTKLPVNTVDIGMAQLAMHSCFETMGSRDVAHFVRAVTACYEAALTFTDTQVTLG